MDLPVIYILAGNSEQFSAYCAAHSLNPLFTRNLDRIEKIRGLRDIEVRYVGTYWENPIFKKHLHVLKAAERTNKSKAYAPQLAHKKLIKKYLHNIKEDAKLKVVTRYPEAIVERIDKPRENYYWYIWDRKPGSKEVSMMLGAAPTEDEAWADALRTVERLEGRKL